MYIKPNHMTGGRSRKKTKFHKEELEDFDYETSQKQREEFKDFHSFSFKKDIVLKTEKQKDLMRAIHENHIVFVSGAAGVGKTFVALKGALELLKDPLNPIDKLIVSKPIVEAGENIGFLPGTLEEKIAPYLQSYHGNLKQLIGAESANQLVLSKVLEAMPLAYLRGDTFRNSVAILDEAQNTTVTGLKLFLSRIGENSKLIIMGDVDQTDLPFRKNELSGLEDAFERFQNVKGVGFVQFTEDDIVRHSILIDLMKRYNKK